MDLGVEHPDGPIPEATPRGWTSNGPLLIAAAILVVGIGLIIAVLVRSGGDDAVVADPDASTTTLVGTIAPPVTTVPPVTTEPQGTTEPQVTTEAPATSAPTTTGAATTSSSTTTSTPTTSAAPTTLPPLFDGPQPDAGDALIVVGVAVDDTLNIRSGPGVSYPVIGELAPNGSAVAAGNAVLLARGLWVQLSGNGGGWVNSAFVSEPGATDDLTSELGGPGAIGAETLLDLARRVGRLRASVDPASTIVVVAGPTVGDLGEVTVDVLGFGDDAVEGERLDIFAVENERGDGWLMRTVERTSLCVRGVTNDGLCV